MRTTDLALLCLTCLAALAFVPVFCEGPDKSSYSPSLAKNLTCTGMDGFVDANTTFEQKTSFNKTLQIATGMEFTDRCENTDLKEVRVQIGEYDPKSILPSNEIWSCNVYGNGYKNFTVMDLTITKPDGAKDKKLNCTYDGKPCPIVLDSEKEYRVVVGMPVNCTAYTEPTTTAPPTTTAVPTTTAKLNATTSDSKGGETTTTSKPTDSSTAKPSSGGDDKKDGKGGQDQVRLASACILTALVATLASRLNMQL